jgi:hypothetical protein
MLGIAWLADRTGQIALTSMLGQIWILPFLVSIYVLNPAKVSKWLIWSLVTLLLSYPQPHAVQVGKLSLLINSGNLRFRLTLQGWNSRNSNTVRSRTVSAAMYNMFCQAGGIVASNIYRAGKLIIPYYAEYLLIKHR